MSLIDLYNFWFSHQHLWFNATPIDDEIIREKFSLLLHNPPELDTLTTIKDKVSYVILLDQIPRHTDRGNYNIINKYLNYIAPIAKDFYEQELELTPDEFSFLLLPLRHTKTYDNFYFVARETWKRISPNYVRFLTATYQKYAEFSFDYDWCNIEVYNTHVHRTIISDKLQVILDKSSNHGELIFDNDNIYNTVSHFDKSKLYILSLSGGVDSMVLSMILKKNNINFVAVHISYGYRIECEQEIEFLKEWADILGFTLYIRKVTEIYRRESMEHGVRELYEQYTRDIRFNTYRIVSSKLGYDNYNVCLGHNKDDQFENMLTNIASQSHYDNLSGMKPEQEISKIVFHRPLLNTPKSDIYKFAHTHNVQHLPNSTPAWSQRGKIRDKVRPTLLEWNPVMVDSMHKLSHEMSQYVEFIQQTANIIGDELVKTNTCKVNINNYYKLETYWQQVFRHNGVWTTQKSIVNWIEKLDYIKQRFQHIHLNVKEKFNLNKSTQIKWKKINDIYIMIELIKQ